MLNKINILAFAFFLVTLPKAALSMESPPELNNPNVYTLALGGKNSLTLGPSEEVAQAIRTSGLHSILSAGTP